MKPVAADTQGGPGKREGHLRALLRLADYLRTAQEPAEMASAAAEVAGRELGVACVVFGEVEAGRSELAYRSEWNNGQPGRTPFILDQFIAERRDELSAGSVVVQRAGPASDNGEAAVAAGTSAIAVPALAEGRLSALVGAACVETRQWSPDEVALLREIAVRTSLALRQAEAAGVLRRNQIRQSFLLVLGDRLRELDDPLEIMGTVADALGRHLHASRAGCGEVLPDGCTIEFKTGWSEDGSPPIVGSFSLGSLDGSAEDDLRRGLTAVFETTGGREAAEVARPNPLTLGMRSTAAVPLIREGRLRALLTLGHRHRHRWTADEIALAGEAAARMWETLERARAEAALRELNATLESRVEQRTAELRSSETRFRTLFENAPAAIFLIRAGRDGRADYEAVNAATEQFLGLEAGDILGRNVAEVANAGPGMVQRCRECASSGHPLAYEVTVEVGSDPRTAEGVLAPLPLDNGDGQLLIGIARDITAQRRAEEQLRQAQKMEAIGQLTGGIAHDFNNLLTGIIGSLALMEKRLAQGRVDAIERYIELAMTSANRAASLTHRLLAFSRRQPLQAKPVDVNHLVGSMGDLLRRTLGESVVLEIVSAPDLWLTLCDPHQLENALLNLAINARDAMPDGGRLTIRTGNAELNEADVADEPGARPGSCVSLSVTDTGTGMPATVIARAFDPFFTTKPLGQGTGLGLSMIYGFVKQSDGHTKIHSEVGAGTTVSIYLPRFFGHQHTEADDDSASPTHAKAGETVLVVEDDPTVRGLILEVLQGLGYTAIEAPDGPEGLAVLQSDRRIDLLMTDVGLPGMNGRQLADQARAARPGLKVLFITGYAEDSKFGHGQPETGTEMMTKPFAVDALALRIRSMIEHG